VERTKKLSHHFDTQTAREDSRLKILEKSIDRAAQSSPM
jgi:hypothetical protein